jgi:geranylgeranyl diphosphate synthase type II
VSAFAAFLERARPEIEAALAAALPAAEAWPVRLHEAMRYSVFAGGKRLRPALVLAAGEAFAAPRARLLPGAAAVELIHTYSLIHDDLPALDDDDLRRGLPTLHRRFDEPTAILAGDALLTLGLARLATEPAELDAERRARAVAAVGAAIGTGGMIGGQFEDVESERSWPADAAGALDRIHRGKTGALLTACLRLGGIYAGASAAEEAALAAFGERAGLMFQVADDILDVLGDVRELGKTPGKDAQAKKLTYPGLHGLAASREALATLAAEATELARALPDPAGVFAALPGYLAVRDR